MLFYHIDKSLQRYLNLLCILLTMKFSAQCNVYTIISSVSKYYDTFKDDHLSQLPLNSTQHSRLCTFLLCLSQLCTLGIFPRILYSDLCTWSISFFVHLFNHLNLPFRINHITDLNCATICLSQANNRDNTLDCTFRCLKVMISCYKVLRKTHFKEYFIICRLL